MSRDHDPQYRPAPDPYAHARCGCGHLVYADQVDGDACHYCTCLDHRRPA